MLHREAEQIRWGGHRLQLHPQCPPGTLHWAEDWEQVLLQFPFRAQGSAGRTLGEEENSLTWTGTGEKLGETRNKRQKAGAGCWGEREQEPAGRTYPRPSLGFSPQHLYFYISLLPGLNGLQNRLNASSDLQQHRFLPGHPIDSTGEDLTNWIGTGVVLHDGFSDSSGYFKRANYRVLLLWEWIRAVHISFKNWKAIVANHSFRICKLASD